MSALVPMCRSGIPSAVTLVSLEHGEKCVLLRHVNGTDRVVSLIDRQLRTAIANRRLIKFTYGSIVRVAEPHDYGVQHGALRLLVYQLRSSPFSRGWRMLDVGKISAVTVLEQTFAGTRRAAHQRHYQWDAVFARVD